MNELCEHSADKSEVIQSFLSSFLSALWDLCVALRISESDMNLQKLSLGDEVKYKV